jgi:DNA-binding GntR family transcriptional regulator
MRDPDTNSPVVRRQVTSEIQRRILSGEQRPGQRLPQQRLARELGVGQGTVRESLLELEWAGLVESIDRVGVFVGELNGSRICEAYLIREVLEGLAARLACSRASQADVAALKSKANSIRLSATDRQLEQMVETDRAFHAQIVKISGNALLIRIADSYHVLGMMARSARDAGAVYREHMGIVDAIERRMPMEAEKLARAHVKETRMTIEQACGRIELEPRWTADTLKQADWAV